MDKNSAAYRVDVSNHYATTHFGKYDAPIVEGARRLYINLITTIAESTSLFRKSASREILMQQRDALATFIATTSQISLAEAQTLADQDIKSLMVLRPRGTQGNQLPLF